MSLYISVPADSRLIELIRAKADSLKCPRTSEKLVPNGLTLGTERSTHLDVYTYSDELWQYISSIEPVNEDRKPVKGFITGPSALEVVTMGYPEPGKK